MTALRAWVWGSLAGILVAAVGVVAVGGALGTAWRAFRYTSGLFALAMFGALGCSTEAPLAPAEGLAYIGTLGFVNAIIGDKRSTATWLAFAAVMLIAAAVLGGAGAP